MSLPRTHNSCGNKIGIGGGQEQRIPYEISVNKRQKPKESSKDLLNNVRTAVFSHLGVDPDGNHRDKSPVELHVHHHHHLYVDNNSGPTSPRIAAASDASIGRSSMGSWKDYEEIANKTLLDVLWAKNQPHCSSSVTTKWKSVDEKQNLSSVVKLQQTSRDASAQNASTDASAQSPKNISQERPVLQSGVEKKRSSKPQIKPQTSRSKIRYLEEAAQERIKKLSDLGTLVTVAEAGCRKDSRRGSFPKPGRTEAARRESASQPPYTDPAVYGRRGPKEQVFKEESEAAEASFLAAIKAAKDRLRDLVNECAKANAKAYVPEDVLRKQKELQALEKLQYYFYNQNNSSTGASPARWPSSPGTDTSSSETFSSRVSDGTLLLSDGHAEEVEEMLTRKPRSPPLIQRSEDGSVKSQTPTRASPELGNASSSDAEGISSSREYLKLFRRQRFLPQQMKRLAAASAAVVNPWAKAVESEFAKMISSLPLNNVEDALWKLDRKLTNLENLRWQVSDAVKRNRERSLKKSTNDASTLTTIAQASVSTVTEPESQRKLDEKFKDKQNPVHMLSIVISESEKLRDFLEETKQKFLVEEQRNVLLKKCVGDLELYEKEHAILDSALALNSELIDNLSGMNYALTSYGTATRNLLPFLDEYLTITERLREAVSSPRIEEIKLRFVSSEAAEAASVKELRASPKGTTSESSEHHRMLIKEIEDTKKQSKEMVDIMQSLGQHYNILRDKFTRIETEISQRDPAAERFPSPARAEIEAPVAENSYANQQCEFFFKSLAQRKMELAERLHALEGEILASHGETQESAILVDSREQEAENVRETENLQRKVKQLEEELMKKQGRIARLKDHCSTGED